MKLCSLMTTRRSRRAQPVFNVKNYGAAARKKNDARQLQQASLDGREFDPAPKSALLSLLQNSRH